MKIGIFGGTFDPPHLGHRKYVREMIKRMSLDRMIVIPTFLPPHKQQNGAGSEDRLAMARLAFEDIDGVSVSDMEIARGGRSYTCDTVKQLAQDFPEQELIFFIGSDMLLSFHRWKNPCEILKYVKICAVTRSAETDEAGMQAYIQKYFPLEAERFIICGFEPLELSSTAVRQMLERGAELGGVLSRGVIQYIKEKELYL